MKTLVCRFWERLAGTISIESLYFYYKCDLLVSLGICRSFRHESLHPLQDVSSIWVLPPSPLKALYVICASSCWVTWMLGVSHGSHVDTGRAVLWVEIFLYLHCFQFMQWNLRHPCGVCLTPRCRLLTVCMFCLVTVKSCCMCRRPLVFY